MTALEEYERLEATGLWKQGRDDQRREVVVSFGNATLVLSDMNEVPLAHWSLAAVERIGSSVPAIYSIAPDGLETLEIDDPHMVDAVEKIRLPLRPSQPHTGSLRLALFLSSLIFAVLIIWLWLPPTLATYTSRIIPEPKATEIGNNLMGYVERFTGSECSSTDGSVALAKLRARLLPEKPGRIRVADLGAQPAMHLPGGFILLHIAAIEDFSGPAVISGYVLREDLLRDQTDPISDFFMQAGLSATIWFLATGAVDDRHYENYARRKITSLPDGFTPEEILARFERALVPSTPYAYAIDPSGQRTKLLIDLDPIADTYPIILEDSEWLALQAICDLDS